jgi:hypothetical protein
MTAARTNLPLTDENRKSLKRNRFAFSAQALACDLEDHQKIRAVGRVVGMKSYGRYATKMVFQSEDNDITEEFSLRTRLLGVAADAHAYSKIEYAPNTRYLFKIALQTPLTAAEKKKSLRLALLALSVMGGIACAIMAWYSKLWLAFGVMYVCFVAFFSLFLHYTDKPHDTE